MAANAPQTRAPAQTTGPPTSKYLAMMLFSTIVEQECLVVHANAWRARALLLRAQLMCAMCTCGVPTITTKRPFNTPLTPRVHDSHGIVARHSITLREAICGHDPWTSSSPRLGHPNLFSRPGWRSERISSGPQRPNMFCSGVRACLSERPRSDHPLLFARWAGPAFGMETFGSPTRGLCGSRLLWDRSTQKVKHSVGGHPFWVRGTPTLNLAGSGGQHAHELR